MINPATISATAVTIAVNATLAAALSKQRATLLDHFRLHGAVSAAKAIPIDAIDASLQVALQHYQSLGIIQSADTDLHFLDIHKLKAYERSQNGKGARAIAWIAGALLVFIAAVIVAITYVTR